MNKRISNIFVLFICISILTISNASAYEYSVTTIEDYVVLDDLDPWGQQEYANVEHWLHDVAGWTEEFYESEYNVDESDFGTSDTGYLGLDDADFHFHFGHGVDDVGTELALRNWLPGPDVKDVRAQDVADKWDQDNEWVLLHSCKILRDSDDWAEALKYSHGIMGFSTTVQPSTSFVYDFFDEAITNDAKLCDAFYDATVNNFGSSVTAVMIADTNAQLCYDHLNGQGTMQPSETTDDSSYAYLSWGCI